MGRGGARAGAGRKLKGLVPRVPVCLTLEQTLLEDLSVLAEARALSLSELVNTLLKTAATPRPSKQPVRPMVRPESPPTPPPVVPAPVPGPVRPEIPPEFLAILGSLTLRQSYPDPAFWQQSYQRDRLFREAIELLCMNSSDKFKSMVFENQIFVSPREVISLAEAPPGFRLTVLEGLLAGLTLAAILTDLQAHSRQ